MKTLLLVTAASLAFAGAAAAQTADQATIIINGDNPAKCGVISSPAVVTLAADSISDGDGFANPNLGNAVAAALTSASPVRVYCTGANNGVVLGRTSLRSGDGTALNGFNRAIVYDIALSIAGATREDNVTPLEGSSDGGNGGVTGPGSPSNGNDVSSFGATAAGALVSWVREAGSTAFSTTDSSSGYDRTSDYDASNGNRLAAGAYTGTVQITLTPRV